MTSEKKETSVLRSFILTDRMHRRLFESKMAGIGIHRSQHRVLMYLFKHLPDAPSQKELAEHFDISKPSLSHHLATLKNAGLVTDERHGQNIVYSLNTTVMQDLIGWFMGFTNTEGDKDE